MNNGSNVLIDIQLSLTKVARIVEENAGFHVSSVKKIGEGLDSQSFLVNDSWVFRFPKHYSEEHDPSAEQQLLQKLKLSTTTPTIDFIWTQPWGYPDTVSGYRFLPGTALERFRPEELNQLLLAQLIGTVLAELHMMGGEGVKSCFDPLESLRTWLETLDDQLGSLVNKAISHSDKLAIKEYVAQYSFDLPESVGVLIHGDLGVDHILLDEQGRLSGIIDWSNHAVGNPYRDYVGLWRWGGDAFCKQVLSHYPFAPRVAELAFVRVLGLISCISRIIVVSELANSGLQSRALSLLEQRVSEIADKSPYQVLNA